MRSPRYVITRTDAAQQFHVRLVSPNGKTIWHTENLTSKRGALNAIKVDAGELPILLKIAPETKHGQALGHIWVNRERRPIYLVDERKSSAEAKTD